MGQNLMTQMRDHANLFNQDPSQSNLSNLCVVVTVKGSHLLIVVTYYKLQMAKYHYIIHPRHLFSTVIDFLAHG